MAVRRQERGTGFTFNQMIMGKLDLVAAVLWELANCCHVMAAQV